MTYSQLQNNRNKTFLTERKPSETEMKKGHDKPILIENVSSTDYIYLTRFKFFWIISILSENFIMIFVTVLILEVTCKFPQIVCVLEDVFGVTTQVLTSTRDHWGAL